MPNILSPGLPEAVFLGMNEESAFKAADNLAPWSIISNQAALSIELTSMSGRFLPVDKASNECYISKIHGPLLPTKIRRPIFGEPPLVKSFDYLISANMMLLRGWPL